MEVEKESLMPVSRVDKPRILRKNLRTLACFILILASCLDARSAEIVNESCSEMVSRHSPKDVQSKKHEYLQSYVGRSVQWTGRLERTNETLWGIEAEIRCSPGPGPAEVTVSFDESVKGELLKLTPGQQLGYSGEIEGISEVGGIIIRSGKLGTSRPIEPTRQAVTEKTSPAAQQPSSAAWPATSQKVWKEPLTGMEFIWVPGGCFLMGCGGWSEECAKSELPVHEVCVSGFWMGKYEVTQGQWKKIMGFNPAGFQTVDSFPVEMVSWQNAKDYAGKFGSLTASKINFRLPTESEWEFACRSGGHPELYSGGRDLNSLGWFDANSSGVSHLVGGMAPNGLGIFDMSGNIWEWCEDIYDPLAYAKHPRNNPLWQKGGSERVIRGGCWYGSAKAARCTSRWSFPITKTRSDLGFRLVVAGVKEDELTIASARQVQNAVTGQVPIGSTANKWFIILGSYPKVEREKAEERLTLLRPHGVGIRIVDTQDFPNLRIGLWAVVAGPFSKDTAEKEKSRLKAVIPDAFIKSGW